MFRNPARFLIWNVGSIYIPVIKRANDGVRLNIDDLDKERAD